MIKVVLFFSLVILLNTSCVPGRLGKKGREIYVENKVTIPVSQNPNDSLIVLYTGCGGMLINYKSSSILIDPFYSYANFAKLIFCKIRTDTNQTNSIAGIIQNQCGGVNKISTVLISHSHYDHILDLPFLMNHQLKDNKLKIVGSESTGNFLNNLNLPEYDLQIPAFENNQSYCTYTINPQIKITVIQSEHAPHAKFLGFIKFKFMKGEIKAKGVKGFNEKKKANFLKWKEGKDYSYLIEIKADDTSKVRRIFVQGSSCKPPNGIPPLNILPDSVDFAFIGVASANNIKNYPMQLLQTIKPKKVIFIHWEDFFRSYIACPKIVRATNFKKYLGRYKKVMGKDYKTRTIMPRQGTKLVFLF